MKQRLRLFLFICLAAALPGTAGAFVPQTPHLLHLVISKIKQPVGVEARQTTTLLDCDTCDEQQADIREILIYDFPGRFRSDILSDSATSFKIESALGFIKISNGATVSTQKSFLDFYTDILLYRDHEALTHQLQLAGIDTQRVSLRRDKETICYVIGQPGEAGTPFAGLWIEKDTLLPFKYVVTVGDTLVECRYAQWMKISKTWYPMQVSILLDDQVFAAVDVSDVELKTGFAPALFDISDIKRLYPRKLPADVPEATSEGVDELEERIETFRKLYD